MLYAFDSRLAERYGVDEAIFLHNLCFWVTKNQRDGRNFHDGYTWTYNSVEAFRELFPFWTNDQIRRIIRNLQKQGAIRTGCYNRAGFDHTRWYTLDESILSIWEKNQIDLGKSPNRSGKTPKPIPDSKPDRKPDSKPNTADQSNENERREQHGISAEAAAEHQAAGGDQADRPLIL